MNIEAEIRICSNHQDYLVPLKWTMAFMGAEYWCPYCGFTGGMFESGEIVEKTDELEVRLQIYSHYSKEYRNAMGCSYASKILFNGEYVAPKDLPQDEKDRLHDIRERGWKYEKKSEEFDLFPVMNSMVQEIDRQEELISMMEKLLPLPFEIRDMSDRKIKQYEREYQEYKDFKDKK